MRSCPVPWSGGHGDIRRGPVACRQPTRPGLEASRCAPPTCCGSRIFCCTRGTSEAAKLIPAAYVALCSKPSPYDPHAPYSLQFTVNTGRHVAGAPRDAFFKSGAGGLESTWCPRWI
jgi:hypothetical protein